MNTPHALVSPAPSIDAAAAVNMHYSIIAAVTEFMAAYTSPESERHTSALRASFEMIETKWRQGELLSVEL